MAKIEWDEQTFLALDDAVVDSIVQGTFKVGDKTLREWGFRGMTFGEGMGSGVVRGEQVITMTVEGDDGKREYEVRVRPKTKRFKRSSNPELDEPKTKLKAKLLK